ncbi:SDR family oxidoreductase [Zavarzinella formosa]|uniref:hypothetical protein n=1 Tax=Zavarzinella formosa TaxID=360055 RepID=UPI0012FC627B|nr:hypothetical protein [Zavarzinella formosa]
MSLHAKEDGVLRAPLPNHTRTEYFDDRGQSYHTEWAPCSPAPWPPPAVRVGLVADLRSGGNLAAALSLRHGYHVFGAGPGGEAIAADIRRQGGSVTVIPAAVTDSRSAGLVVDAVMETGGQLDLVVAHAAKGVRHTCGVGVLRDVAETLSVPFLLGAAALGKCMLARRTGVLAFIGAGGSSPERQVAKAGLRYMCGHFIGQCEQGGVPSCLVRYSPAGRVNLTGGDRDSLRSPAKSDDVSDPDHLADVLAWLAADRGDVFDYAGGWEPGVRLVLST